jgi:hypothetical protein
MKNDNCHYQHDIKNLSNKLIGLLSKKNYIKAEDNTIYDTEDLKHDDNLMVLDRNNIYKYSLSRLIIIMLSHAKITMINILLKCEKKYKCTIIYAHTDSLYISFNKEIKSEKIFHYLNKKIKSKKGLGSFKLEFEKLKLKIDNMKSINVIANNKDIKLKEYVRI